MAAESKKVTARRSRVIFPAGSRSAGLEHRVRGRHVDLAGHHHVEVVTVDLGAGGEDGRCSPLIHADTMAQPPWQGNNLHRAAVARVTSGPGDRLAA